MTAVGPGTGLQVTPRDRSGGSADGIDRDSPAAYPAVENNTVILVLAEIAVNLATREREARAKLRVVEDPAA